MFLFSVNDLFCFEAKTLYELIQPSSKRMSDVQEFMQDVDSTLMYQIVSINDPFGPTKTDPDMQVIIKSMLNICFIFFS